MKKVSLLLFLPLISSAMQAQIFKGNHDKVSVSERVVVDSNHHMRFQFSSGDTIINKSTDDKFCYYINGPHRRVKLVLMNKGTYNLKEYAKLERKANKDTKWEAGATNYKTGDLEKIDCCNWSYSQTYTAANGTNREIMTVFKYLTFKSEILQASAIFDDDAFKKDNEEYMTRKYFFAEALNSYYTP